MTLDDKAYAMFVASPWVWFGAKELQDQLGFCAWRTRVSSARRRGLNIQNKIVLTPEGRKLSFYQYCPAPPSEGTPCLFSGDASLFGTEPAGTFGHR